MHPKQDAQKGLCCTPYQDQLAQKVFRSLQVDKVSSCYWHVKALKPSDASNSTKPELCERVVEYGMENRLFGQEDVLVGTQRFVSRAKLECDQVPGCLLAGIAKDGGSVSKPLINGSMEV